MAFSETRGLTNLAFAILAGCVTGGLLVRFRTSLLAYEVPTWFRAFQVLLAVTLVGLLFGLAYEATESRLVMLVAHGASTLVVTTVGFVVVGTLDVAASLVVLALLPIVAGASLTYTISPDVRGLVVYVVASLALVFLGISLLVGGVGVLVKGELSTVPLLLVLFLVFAVYYQALLGFVPDSG